LKHLGFFSLQSKLDDVACSTQSVDGHLVVNIDHLVIVDLRDHISDLE
jgi:hypothetical protein